MNPDELLAVADAVVQALSYYPGDEWYSQKTATAADELATHVQKMYDPTPVDEAWWMAATGGRKAVGFNAGYAAINHNRVEFVACGVDFYASRERGDVRRLCEMLGIELREDGT